MADQAQAAAIEQTSNNSNGNTKHYHAECLVSLTLYTKENGNLTKTISLDDSGHVVKNSSECWMANGTAETITMPFAELPAFFNTVKQNQAVGWGTHFGRLSKIVSQKQMQVNAQPDCITRSKSNFSYPEGKAGVLLLDNDSGMDNLQIISVIESIVPGFDKAAKIIKPSVSAELIRKSTGEALPGKNNAHIYVLVKNAADIPRFGKVLHKRLIFAGYGRVEFSKDGKILIRTLVDQFVHSPERLDFAAPPILIGDLEQRLPEIQYLPGDALDSSMLLDLNEVELIQYEKIVRDLRKGAEKEAHKIHEKYISEEGKKIAKTQNISIDSARQIVRDRTNNILSGDDVLTFDDGVSATVREILKDLLKFNFKTMPYPVGHEYGGERNKAILYANIDTGTPIVHSFKHGGQIFRLLYDFHDLKAMFERKGANLENWAALIANGHVSDEQSEELINIVHKQKEIGLKTLRKSLKDALTTRNKSDQLFTSEYQTSEHAYLNLQYGCALIGGKAVVLEESYDEEVSSWVLKLHNPRELGVYLSNERIPKKDGEGTEPIFPVWLNSPDRNTYENIVFRPDPKIYRSGPRIIQQRRTYNLWQGFSVAPIKGNCALVLDHIKCIWCSDDEEMFSYVLDWLANMFQHPYRQGKTAIVLRSGQGAGKNIIAEDVIGTLFGTHALIATRKEDFLGKFNSLLGQSVFVYANEAVWAGEKEKQGTLKALITDRYLTVEKKYLDSFKFRNCTHILFASNDSYVAPADIGDRRFVYPNVSNHREGDSAYFTELGKQINDGGCSAFLYEMLNRDLTGVDLTKLPKKQGAQRTIDFLQTMPPHVVFLYDLLSDEYFEAYLNEVAFIDQLGKTTSNLWDEGGWRVSKELFHQMYLIFCKKNHKSYPEVKAVLIKKIRADIPGILSDTKSSDGENRVNCLKFLPFSEARDLFEKKTKLAFDSRE